MYPRLFQFGSLAIPTSGVCTAAAIILALFLARFTGRRLGLEPDRLWDLGIAGVLSALVGSRLLLILTSWRDFTAHPLWMLGLLTVRSPFAVWGGAALALGVMVLYAHYSRLPVRRSLDAFAPAAALAYVVVALGQFLAGSDFGSPSTQPWGVVYTRRLASLWYHTPLGVPLHPVQLYQASAELLFLSLAMLIILGRQGSRLRDGEIFGGWLFLHGCSSFFLDFFRAEAGSSSLAFSPWDAALLVLAGGLFWLL